MKKRKPKKPKQPTGGTFIPHSRNDSNVKRMDAYLQAKKAKHKNYRPPKPSNVFSNGTVVLDRASNTTGIIEGTTQISSLMIYENDTFAYRLRVGTKIVLASPMDVVKVAEGDRRRILHREYLLSIGITEQRYIPRRGHKKYLETHCWRCETELDSVSDAECLRCGRLICDCGACWCGTWWDPNRAR